MDALHRHLPWALFLACFLRTVGALKEHDIMANHFIFCLFFTVVLKIQGDSTGTPSEMEVRYFCGGALCFDASLRVDQVSCFRVEANTEDWIESRTT